MSADMGSAGSALDDRARTEFGRDRWRQHQETVAAFWNSIAGFFEALDPTGCKIYQDGLVADGPDGLKIVKEGVSQGSKNFEIVARMLERGALLVRTEALALVKQEQIYVTQIARSVRLDPKEASAIRKAQGRLIVQRDDFIAQRIARTLAANETGVLFIGAYHDVLSRLPHDIRVIQVKDLAKIREYYRNLAASTPGGYRRRLDELAAYLTSPVPVPGVRPARR